MNKKHIFTAIGIFVVTLIYGSIFNFILRGDDALIEMSIIWGFFVGANSMLMYIIQILCWGFVLKILKNKEKLDWVDNTFIILENIILFACIFSGISIFITENEKLVITQSCAWMHIVNMLFSIAIVFKANYDAKGIRENKNI